MSTETHLCRHCGIELKEGDARFSRDEPDFYAHYSCHEKLGEPVPDPEEVFRQINTKSIERIDTAFANLREAVSAFDTQQQAPRT